MNNSFLVNYNKSGQSNSDFSEKVGNFGVGLLSIGLGNWVKVEHLCINGKERVMLTPIPVKLRTRVAAMGVFLCFPMITVPLLFVGFLGKKYSKSYQMTKQLSEQTQNEQRLAAIKIQKHFRGHLARKAHLPRNMHSHGRTLHQECELQCKRTEERGNQIPRANVGITPVYLPQEMAIAHKVQVVISDPHLAIGGPIAK